MSQEFVTINQFLKSLDPRQRRYFLGREAQIQVRLQTGLRELGRGLSEVASLNGEALAVILTAEENASRG